MATSEADLVFHCVGSSRKSRARQGSLYFFLRDMDFCASLSLRIHSYFFYVGAALFCHCTLAHHFPFVSFHEQQHTYQDM